MYRGYLALAILIIRINGFVVDDINCDRIHNNNCNVNSNSDPTNSAPTAITSICTEEEVPKDVNFVLIYNASKIPAFSNILKVDFAAPKTKCKYGVALLANSSIENEDECANYNFKESKDQDVETHKAEEVVCVVTDEDDRSVLSGNSTETSCQRNIEFRFKYVFTGCYAIRFSLDNFQFAIRGNKFVKTDYKQTEVAEPMFQCTYDVVSSDTQSKETIHFATGISMLPDTKQKFRIEISTDPNEDKACSWYSLKWKYEWDVSWGQNATHNRNCTSNLVQDANGNYMRNVECDFLVEISQSTNYCLMLRLLDDRCKRHSLWNPPMNNNMPCAWIKRCTRTLGNTLNDEYVANEAQTWMNNNSYLLLPIVIIVSTMFTMFGMIYFVYYLRARKEQVALYMHAHKNEFARTIVNKSKICNVDSDEKEMEYEEPVSRNIVLLYPRSSAPFMALMEELRGILARVCQCSVHDWYDATVWNHVAKIGGLEWFTEMLDSGCRVIWMDTPAMRSLIKCKFKKETSKTNSERNKYMEIGDFRDVLFPVILNLAKRNIQESILRYPKHFIVRLKGFESFEDDNDPFLDLDAHVRYLMPQDLSFLCSHLSTPESNARMQDIRMEEDFIRQHLHRVKFESCK